GAGVSRGFTPLHAAATTGDLEAVRLLIAHGADVNLNDADNESALMLVMLSRDRSEEHTSELQSRENLVCRLLLEKKKNKNKPNITQPKRQNSITGRPTQWIIRQNICTQLGYRTRYRHQWLTLSVK